MPSNAASPLVPSDQPDLASLGALIGDPARASMLTTLMGGRALTVGELAREAGITPQTASSHLARMEASGLLRHRRQGRHKYVALRDSDVAGMLESLMGIATAAGHGGTRTGPADPALRQARVCYDHLAGARAVTMLDALIDSGALDAQDGELCLTDWGGALFEQFGIDIATLRQARRPLCRACLDWSERRSHLGGALGAAVLQGIYDRGWARRQRNSRAVRFTVLGLARFRETFAHGR